MSPQVRPQFPRHRRHSLVLCAVWGLAVWSWIAPIHRTAAQTSVATAQASAAATLEDERLAQVRRPLTATVARARATGLPEAWLLDKVREGLAKRVPAPQIAMAVQGLYGRMQAADRMLMQVQRESVGPAASRTDTRSPEGQATLRALVDALAAGAPEVEMAGLVRSVAGRGASSRVGDAKGAPRRAAEVQQRLREGAVTVAELGERGFEGASAVRATLQAYERAGTSGWGQLLVNARQIRDADPGRRAAALHQAADSVHPRGPEGGPRGRAPGRAGAVHEPGPPGGAAHEAGPPGGPKGRPPGFEPGRGHPGAGPPHGPRPGPQGGGPRPGAPRGSAR